MYSVATVSNDTARDPTIYFRTRWIDCLQDFVNEFHQLAPSARVQARRKMENRTRRGLVDEFFQKLPSMQLSHLTG